jgi:hypothetical protein
MKKHPSFDELSEIIVDAIIDEPIFSKEKLLPRIKAILRAFNLKLSLVPNLEKEETATEKHKRLLHIQKTENREKFWKGKCQKYLPEKMDEFYKETDELKL